MSLGSPDDVVKFYQGKYTEHGDTPQGMGWRDRDEHYARLLGAKRVVELLNPTASYEYELVLDVGCGIGMLPITWGWPGSYTGIDLVPEYIQEAKQWLKPRTNRVFIQGDFLEEEFIPHNVVVCIGGFAWQPIDIVERMVLKMWELTKPHGVMLFSFIPDNPLAEAVVRWYRQTLGATGSVFYEGYAQTSDKIVAFRKGER